MSIGVNELVKEYEKLIDKLKIVKTKSLVNAQSVGEAIRAAEKTYLKTDEFLSELKDAKRDLESEKPLRVLLEYILIIQIPYTTRLLSELRYIVAKSGDLSTVSKLDTLIKQFSDLRER